jgi:hypothetical protein
MRWILFVSILFSSQMTVGQQVITGFIRDAATGEPLAGAAALVRSTADTTKVFGAVSAPAGTFQIKGVPPGSYRLRIEFIGYAAYTKVLQIGEGTTTLGLIQMKPAASQLKEVVVAVDAAVAQKKGDTLQINATAFKTNPDANAEDLLKKMPGVTAQGGQVSAQGEQVQRVLVDGKPFFGDDPNAALKNLPAQAIDKVQVFDQQSEMAQFSGFNDGNTTKTINIITKKDLKNSQFGKVYGGYGTDGRYEIGGNANLFEGNRRISILGMSNNINKQNFSSEDLVSAFGSFSTNRRGPRRSATMNSTAFDFLVSDQTGITTTHSAGINYADQWGKKVTVSGSYFFNQTSNERDQTLQRNYFAPDITVPLQSDTSFAGTDNTNHRFNARLEYKPNDKNQFLIIPRLSYQTNASIDTALGVNRTAEGTPVSASYNDNRFNNSAYTVGSRLLWRHGFAKKGRSFSIETEGNWSGRTGDATLEALNFSSTLPTDTLSQITPQNNLGFSGTAEVDYTEPMGEFSQWDVNYRFGLNWTDDDRKTFPWLSDQGIVGPPDSLLSNVFTNNYQTHRTGLGYRYNRERWQFNVDVRYQIATLDNDQTFPVEDNINQVFYNWLPSGSVSFNPNKELSIRVFGRTRTQNPSATQLQDVINNANPLVLSTGNPSLRQQNTAFVGTRIALTKPSKSSNMSLFAMAEGTDDFITNATYFAANDTTISGVALGKGTQLTRPENADGFRSARAFLDYGFPIFKRKVNLNLRGGLTFSRSPAIINGVASFADNTSPSWGVTAGSNISENLDFTLTYNGYYAQVVSSASPEQNNRYFNNNVGLVVNWIFKRWVLRSDLNYFGYQGLQDGFNQNFWLWNLGFGRKFLKEDRGELRLVVFDALGQNQSIARTFTETYFEDSQTTVLQRYLMLTFTYNFRHFKIEAPAEP